MGKITRNCYAEGLPFGAMFVVECTNVGLSTIFKAATLKGLSYHVFMAYSYAITALTLLPFIFYGKKDIPPLTCGILARFFGVGITGFSSQYLTYIGIEYTSPTLASTMSTIIPAATFVLAVLFRMEKLEMYKFRSQLKIIGTIITIIGATVVVLYKGSVVFNTHSSSTSTSSTGLLASPDTSRSDWIIGGTLLAASYLLLAVGYIFLAKAVNEYPRELLVVFFINLFLCVIAMPISFITEPDLSAWRLKPDVRLFSCLYAGIIGGLGVIVQTWGLHVKGPTYVALFRPLSIAIAVILGVLFLGDNLYLGSIIGAVIISMGFYLVIWGKSQEEAIEVVDDDILEESNVPLLA